MVIAVSDEISHNINVAPQQSPVYPPILRRIYTQSPHITINGRIAASAYHLFSLKRGMAGDRKSVV